MKTQRLITEANGIALLNPIWECLILKDFVLLKETQKSQIRSLKRVSNMYIINDEDGEPLRRFQTKEDAEWFIKEDENNYN